MMLLNLLLLGYITSVISGPSTPFGRRQTRHVVQYSWRVTPIVIAGDGYSRDAIGINDRPAHEFLIDVEEGSWVEVTVQNDLKMPTTLHFHGIFQNGTVESDGAVGITQCPIAPGKSFTYRWLATQVGTYWWHGHYGGQYLDGLRGPLIIRANPEVYAKEYDDEMIVQLTDWYHEQSNVLIDRYLHPTANPDGDEPVWASGLINGNGRYNCDVLKDKPSYCDSHHRLTVFDVTPGTRYRLRLINMSGFAAFNVSLDGHVMRVIEVDGVDVKPVLVNRLTINVAQRYSVIVYADQSPGIYHFRATMLTMAPWTSLPNDRLDPGLHLFTGALWNYRMFSVMNMPQSALPFNPSNFIDLDDINLEPVMQLNAPAVADISLDFTFSFHSTNTDPVQRAYVSLDFAKTEASFVAPKIPILNSVLTNPNWKQTMPGSQFVYELFSHQVVQMTIWNDDPGEHPFHLHGHQFWILAKGLLPKGTTSVTNTSNFRLTNPSRRDVITVPGCTPTANGTCADIAYTVVRFRADNPGVWLFHCHLQFHLKAGLAMVFVESASVLQQKMLNGRGSDMQQLCVDSQAMAVDG